MGSDCIVAYLFTSHMPFLKKKTKTKKKKKKNHNSSQHYEYVS